MVRSFRYIISALNVFQLKGSHVNYLLSTCATAKLPALAYETILKYSGSESRPEKLTLWKVDTNHSNIQESLQSEKHGSLEKNIPGHVNTNREPVKIKKIFSFPTVTPESYDIALKVCGSSGDLTTAYKLTQLMKVKRIPMTTEGWNSVLNAVMFALCSFFRTFLCPLLFVIVI